MMPLTVSPSRSMWWNSGRTEVSVSKGVRWGGGCKVGRDQHHSNTVNDTSHINHINKRNMQGAAHKRQRHVCSKQWRTYA